MSEQDQLDQIIELIDDEGNPVRFSHVMTYEHAGARYVALEPEETFSQEEGEVVLLRVEREGEEDIYLTIDDEIEENNAFAAFLELYGQMISDDEDDEDDQDGVDDGDGLN